MYYTDPNGHWAETVFDAISLGMTINDIRNEGWTVMNTISLVTDVASIVIPFVPAGVSHALRAAKLANKAVNAVDTAEDTTKILYKAGNVVDSSPSINPAKLEKILTNLKKEGVDVFMGKEARDLLAEAGAVGAYKFRINRPGVLILPDNPSQATVIEELIHLGQDRRSGWTLFSELKKSKAAVETRLEAEAQRKLLKIGDRLKWPQQEMDRIRNRLSNLLK